MPDVFDRCGDPVLKFAKDSLFAGFRLSFDMMNYCAFGDTKSSASDTLNQQAVLDEELVKSIYPCSSERTHGRKWQIGVVS